jgi:hypothetical protein
MTSRLVGLQQLGDGIEHMLAAVRPKAEQRAVPCRSCRTSPAARNCAMCWCIVVCEIPRSFGAHRSEADEHR